MEEPVNTIMSDQLCANCQLQEAEPGDSLCHNCLAADNAPSWAPKRNTLADLDQLEDRPIETPVSIVSRLIWWLAFIVIVGFVLLLAVDKTHIPIIDDIPGISDLRQNFNNASNWWADGIRKLGDSIGL
jgi:hypothetical protein